MNIKSKKELKGFTGRELPKKEQRSAELALDIYEDENEIMIVSLVAGIKSDDLEVNLEKGMLTIKGARQSPIDCDDESLYLCKECYWGTFSRRVVLPEEINPSKIEASLKNGLLILKIPKIAYEEVNRKLKVKYEEE